MSRRGHGEAHGGTQKEVNLQTHELNIFKIKPNNGENTTAVYLTETSMYPTKVAHGVAPAMTTVTWLYYTPDIIVIKTTSKAGAHMIVKSDLRL